ncbi:MAG: hypothetical protein D6734_12765, partial [Candidatus Schekmanbacteria bacterium]
LMTSKYPIQHRCLSYNNPLSDDEMTLAEVLRDNGYYTGAFISTFLVSSRFGFNQGFDYFDEDLDPDYQRPATKFHEKSLQWIENNKNRNFFLWLHYFEPHYPYLEHKPYTEKYESYLNGEKKGKFEKSHEWIKEVFNRRKEDLSEADINRLRSLYGGEITYLDKFIGEVIEKLKEEGIYDNTIIVFTSDHGEMLGEQHLIEHGDSLYQPEIHVPLIFKLPDKMGIAKGKRLDALVELTDVMPTLLALLDISSPVRLEGVNLYPLMSGERESVRSYAFSEVHNYKSIIKGDWKYIMSLPVLSAPMLFNLKDDINERKNLYFSNIEMGRNLRKEILKRIEKLYQPAQRIKKVTKKEEERLKSLGYINQGKTETMTLGKYPPPNLIGEIKNGNFIWQGKVLGRNEIVVKARDAVISDDKLIVDSGEVGLPLRLGENNKELTVEFWIKPGWEWSAEKERNFISFKDRDGEIVSIDVVNEAIDPNDGKVYKGAFLRISLKGIKRYVYYDISKLSGEIEHHILFTFKDARNGEKGIASLLIDGVKEEFSPSFIFSKPIKSDFVLWKITSMDTKSFIKGLKIYSNFYNPPSIIIPVFRKAMDLADNIYLKDRT